MDENSYEYVLEAGAFRVAGPTKASEVPTAENTRAAVTNFILILDCAYVR